jgi:hypothetical protein
MLVSDTQDTVQMNIFQKFKDSYCFFEVFTYSVILQVSLTFPDSMWL